MELPIRYPTIPQIHFEAPPKLPFVIVREDGPFIPAHECQRVPDPPGEPQAWVVERGYSRFP